MSTMFSYYVLFFSCIRFFILHAKAPHTLSIFAGMEQSANNKQEEGETTLLYEKVKEKCAIPA